VLEKQKKNGVTRKLCGFEMCEKAIPRHGYDVVDATGNKIGLVTSGTMSPSLKKGIGMAYLKTEFAKVGTEIFIQIRNKNVKAVTGPMPFFKK
jgi:aminomethyltransferase